LHSRVTEQIEYIMNHAEDVAMFVDVTFVSILEGIKVLASSLRLRSELPRGAFICLPVWRVPSFFALNAVVALAAQDKLTCKKFIVMTDEKHMPKNKLGALCYETVVRKHSTSFKWPIFRAFFLELWIGRVLMIGCNFAAENTASSLCYTSGTTGNPKGLQTGLAPAVSSGCLFPNFQACSIRTVRPCCTR
jgi:acyl-CoA synthetase (AMP-forming)/AMP-acid ligase II